MLKTGLRCVDRLVVLVMYFMLVGFGLYHISLLIKGLDLFIFMANITFHKNKITKLILVLSLS